MPDPYGSEVKYQGGASLDFVEIAVDAGTDVSSIFVTIYNVDGSVQSVNALGTLVGTQFGQDIYVIDIATSGTFDGLHKSSGVALEQDGTLVSFISFDNGSPITATAALPMHRRRHKSDWPVVGNRLKPPMAVRLISLKQHRHLVQSRACVWAQWSRPRPVL